jgi:hypothetical protein
MHRHLEGVKETLILERGERREADILSSDA